MLRRLYNHKKTIPLLTLLEFAWCAARDTGYIRGLKSMQGLITGYLLPLYGGKKISNLLLCLRMLLVAVKTQRYTPQIPKK